MEITPLPKLETRRLILKSITPQDFPEYQKSFSNFEIIRHLGHIVPWPYPDDGVKVFFENNVFPDQGKSQWLWGIFLKENPEIVIGAVHLRKGEDENRGFWLAQEHWGQGIMSEAVFAVNDFAFENLGFEKLILSNALGNIASRRVKEKTGAKFLRTEPFKFVDPELKEKEVWILKKEDWLIHKELINKI